MKATLGIFAIYKPKGLTSHDVVNHVRRATGVKRVGHGGTLDPLASGVLVIAVGRENTKQLETYVKGEKEYLATIKLGFESTTDDEEGEKTEINSSLKPSKKEIEEALTQFRGEIMQTPPIYSAIKVGGKTAYKEARKGKSIILEPRKVKIMHIKLCQYKYPFVEFWVTTGPGLYVRSLARDLGRTLKTGAYITELERTRVGEFKKEESITLEKLKS